MNRNEQHIYARQIVLDEIGEDGQQRLLNTRVVIVGAGGLGCPAALYLAASGIGHITLIDGDVVEPSNLQRQILFGASDLNQLKATVAANKLSEMHPHLTIEGHPHYFNEENAISLLKGADIVLDCTDNFAARYLINDACVQLGIPFVSGAIYKFEGQLALLNHQNGPTYRCLFPEFPQEKNHPNCATTGVLGVLPGIIGTLQATETIKWALKMTPLLDREILCYDARTLETRKIKLPPRNEEVCKKVQRLPLKSHNTEQDIALVEWDALDTALFQQIVDVRELHETPESPQFTTHSIPWSDFERNLNQLQANLPTAVFCQSGQRSAKAAQLLQETGFNAVSVSGGIQTLLQKKNIV